MQAQGHQVRARLLRLGEDGREEDLVSSDPAECLKMVRPMTLDAQWEPKGRADAGP